jgi:hypothetical protein
MPFFFVLLSALGALCGESLFWSSLCPLCPLWLNSSC